MRSFVKAAFGAVIVLFAASAQVTAQVPAEQLAKPPAGAQRYTILSKAGPHGSTAAWTLPDGTRMARGTLRLRGQVFELDEAVRLGDDGMPASWTTRGFTPFGDAGESFAIANGRATWKTQIDAASAAYAAPAMYVPASPSFTMSTSLTIEALLAARGKSLALLPGGRATAERLTELTVGEGAAQKTVVCWAVSGLALSPVPVWTTEDGKFFGSVAFLAALPVGYEGALDAMTKAQDDALAAKSPAIARAFLKPPSGPVAFTHVRAFVDGARFVEDQTVVVDKGVITQVGSAASVTAPERARVIDGKGHTLVPGLWDSHMHVGDDFSGPMLLSLGVTSVRDPGNDDSLTVARAKRRAAGELLSPKVYASSLIDGKGPHTAQVANVAQTLDEALALVRRAKANGLTGIKIYGTLDPAWVSRIATEAHELGLNVHGHLPAGMRTHEAIELGYDEITHIYFTAMEAMPADVVTASNSIQRVEGPGRYFLDVDLDADPMKSLFALMARRGTVVDPTLVVVESILYAENGELSAAYAPYVGTMPPATERSFRQGGLAVPADLTREQYRKSFARLTELVGALHEAGITIVAGTDGFGMELVRELELYVQAGFTPEEALASATIVPARNVGADGTSGSIAAGKAADLVLVEGNPQRRIGDLRHTRIVMMDGIAMDADALRRAAGFSGRPHSAR